MSNIMNETIEAAMVRLNKSLDPLGIRLHGAAYNRVWEAIQWALDQGPTVTHLAMDPDASDFAKAAIEEVVNAAFRFKPPAT